MTDNPKQGAHLYHTPSGDYLGVARGPASRSGVVRFDGPRMRDGHPVTMATIHEIRIGPPPSDRGAD